MERAPKEKSSVVVVFTGENKGKTEAAIGLACRALGAGNRVAFVQFVKSWRVSEHEFFAKIAPLFPDFAFYKGGKGFVNLGEHSAKNVDENEHKMAARATLDFAEKCAQSGKFDLVVCDEICVAFAENLISRAELEHFIASRNEKTSLCLTGRGWPNELNKNADIVTNFAKIKHHYDDGFFAKVGIDF